MAGALFAVGITLGSIYLTEADTKGRETIGAVMLVVAFFGPLVLIGWARDVSRCIHDQTSDSWV